jgi:hypothetical protein
MHSHFFYLLCSVLKKNVRLGMCSDASENVCSILIKVYNIFGGLPVNSFNLVVITVRETLGLRMNTIQTHIISL